MEGEDHLPAPSVLKDRKAAKRPRKGRRLPAETAPLSAPDEDGDDDDDDDTCWGWNNEKTVQMILSHSLDNQQVRKVFKV